MSTTVIYHSADFDGIFCREIARKFLPPDTEFIGWNFGDPPAIGDPPFGMNHKVYVLDLPLDRVFGLIFEDGLACRDGEALIPLHRIDFGNMVWIDHHKTSIDSHPSSIPGYRIDGVAACRLAWQWFTDPDAEQYRGRAWSGGSKDNFVNRIVKEPLAVRLAGEYDIWDKRDPRAETFQYALRAVEPNWTLLLGENSEFHTQSMCDMGVNVQNYAIRNDASICNSLTWLMEWEGLKFLCINHARFNSLLFAAKDMPETGHDALLGFRFDGKQWMVSLYHAKHRTDLDLSEIAKKYGGGGHRGAAGFVCAELPFKLIGHADSR